MQLFTPFQYMKIMLANTFGLDKETWSKRLDWADDNYKLILNKPDVVAEQASEKYSFLKAAHALKAVEAGKPTGYIGGLDATSSGIQLFGALSGCWYTLLATNGVNGDTDERKDLYTFMVNVMSKGSTAYTRDDMKEPVMTRYYNSQGVPKAVFGEGEELDHFYASLAEVLPGAEDVMEAINSCWQVGTEHSWKAPNGHTIVLPNVEPVRNRIRSPLLQGKSFSFTTHEIVEKDYGISLPAHIAHFCDAYIINRMNDMCNVPFLSNHDCFYTSPIYMNEVRIAFNKALAELHESNMLNDILLQITNGETGYEQFRVDLGDEIRNSDYAIC